MKIQSIKLSRKVYEKTAPLEYAVTVFKSGNAELFLDGNTVAIECGEKTFLNLENRLHEIGIEKMKSEFLIHGSEDFSAKLEIEFADGTIKTIIEDISTFFGQLQTELIGKMIRFKCDLNLIREEDFTDAFNLCAFNNELDAALNLEAYLYKRQAS